jgi:CBS domain-containing protein
MSRQRPRATVPSFAGHLLVLRGNQLVGLLTDRELDAARPSPATSLTVGEIRAALARARAEEVMIRDVVTVAPGTPLAEAARLMRDWQLTALPVLHEGAPVGLLTDATLLGVLGALLEDQAEGAAAHRGAPSAGVSSRRR